jgi:OFA family oxalate/formate antiporter-like MFS transporter
MSPPTTRTATREGTAPDRRIVLACGMLLLACLGTVYAWSYFTKQLGETYGWNKMQIGGVFSLAVAGLGLSAAYTGPLVSTLGSRALMLRSAVFFISGYLITALGLFLAGAGTFGAVTPATTGSLASWVTLGIVGLGYGVVSGIGLGTGYVTGVTTIAGWFPDRKGFATGLVVMGFGMGGFIMSKVFAPLATEVANQNLPLAFLVMAVAYLLIMPAACRGIFSPSFAVSSGQAATVAETIEHTPSVQYKLWVVCFLYSLAGLGIISLLSPLMQMVAKADNAALSAADLIAIGGTLVAAASVGNSVGRLFWAWISDKIGRVNAFIGLLTSAAAVFLILPHVTNPTLYGVLLAYTVGSYGGGFGTIPSLISDLYGPKRMSQIHGRVLTGWASAGLISPPIFGMLMDTRPDQAAGLAFYSCAIVLVLSAALVSTFKPLHVKTTAVTAIEHGGAQPDQLRA